MKEKEFIQKLKEKNEKLLLAMVLDKYHQFVKSGISTYTNFLNDIELEFIKRSLDYLRISYQIYKTNASCEKSIIYFGNYDDFITYYQIKSKDITHPKVLGTLFNIGFTPSMIGDIFIEKDRAYITNLKRYDSLLEISLQKIGTNIVQLEKQDKIALIEKNFEVLTLTVASARVDLIIVRLTKLSRARTLEFMSTKKILLNYKEINKNILLKENDILSIEKHGKYIIKSQEKIASGKVKIIIFKYC